MKKFNTDHIRRRMRDQKGRTFGSKVLNVHGEKATGGYAINTADLNSSVGSDKSGLSSPPIRIPIPSGVGVTTDIEMMNPTVDSTEKENVGQSTVILLKPDSSQTETARPNRPPPLAVTVTIDEDDEEDTENGLDEIEAARSVTSRSTKAGSSNNQDKSEDVSSVWAMMEHYQDDEDKQPQTQHSDNLPVDLQLDYDSMSLPTISLSEPIIDDRTADGERSINTRSPSWTRGRAVIEHNQSLPSPSPKPSNRKLASSTTRSMTVSKEEVDVQSEMKDVRQIHWNMDSNGSLIQASMYSFEESHVVEKDIADDPREEQTSVSELHQRERSLFRSPAPFEGAAGNMSQNEISKAVKPKAIATPAKVRQQFLDEMLDAREKEIDDSTQPGSLLQQSMIDSLSVEQYPKSATKSRKDVPPQVLKDNDNSEGILVVAPGNDAYMDRINELELNLQDQRLNTDEVQDRLKSRVMELEQALRVTAATPRGTIIQQNPLTTLLDRNQTLVKEVRFADQTCVELHSKNSNLEEQIKQLKEKVSTLEVENGDLRIMNSERASKDAETIQQLQEELNNDQTSSDVNADHILLTIRDAFKSWNSKRITTKRTESHDGDEDDDDALTGLSTASDIMSEPGKQTHHPADKKMDQNKDNLNSLDRSIHQLIDQLLTDQEAMSLRADEESDGALDENSKSRIENDFLGRQLGQTQVKLDEVQKLLSTERSRNDALEMQLKRGAETYVRLVDPLEKRLLEVTQAASAIPNGLVNADARLFGLQKELAHAKASLSAIKRESERLLAQKNLTVEVVANAKENEELVAMIQTAFLRISQQYKRLEGDVESAVNNLTARIEKMAETIAFLRSSLLFDNEAGDGIRRPDEIQTRALFQGSKAHAVDDMSAAIEAVQDPSDDDEMLEMMEEARSPRKLEINISADLDDITLESLVKSVSVLSPISHADRFKEPLEAAIRECQRVRERSAILKEEIEKQTATIDQLQGEKQRLVTALLGHEEECHLLKETVDLSNKQVEALSAALKSAEIEKSQEFDLQRKEKEALEQDNVRLHSEARRLRDQESTLTKLLQENESKLVRVKTELNVMTQAHDDLVTRITNSEKEFADRKESELRETSESLRQAEIDLTKLRKSNHDLLQLHSQDKEELSRVTTKTREMESIQKSLRSDLEDRDLEMQYMKEEIRKERAELKSNLSQKDQEITSLKSSLSSVKAKCQTEYEEKEAIIEQLQVLSKMRTDMWGQLRSNGICDELSSISSDFELPETLASAIKEVEMHVSGLPYICAQLQELHKESERLSNVETEVNTRNGQLEILAKREEELRKQNDELFSLLHQADTRVEESLAQVNVMQDTLNEIQEQKQEAEERADTAEMELSRMRQQSDHSLGAVKDDLVKSKAELKNIMEEFESNCLALKAMTLERDSALSELQEVSTQLDVKKAEEGSLKAAVQSLEQKCSRLREYIKKLTGKCSEWEASYDRQATAIERLQDKNRRISTRYKELVEQKREQRRAHQQHRAKWTEERSNLHQVHMTLEHELEEIAQQLALPVDIETPSMD